jgi:trans-aconitate methyltransferase
MNKWKTLWNTKNLDKITSLQDLINVNGFDTSGINEVNLKEYINKVCYELGINSGSSVYEIGCGSGPILNILKSKDVTVGGSDYSSTLIKIANTLNISDDITVCEAKDICTSTKYDYVISNSVFQYFTDLSYTEHVVDLMLEKAVIGIGVLDINDEELKDLYLEIRRRHESSYDEKYNGFEHLFINRSFWVDYATKRNLKIKIQDQQINGYKNQEFRYNVYLTK